MSRGVDKTANDSGYGRLNLVASQSEPQSKKPKPCGMGFLFLTWLPNLNSNQGHANHLGIRRDYAPEEMIGRQMIDLVFSADRARTLKAVERIEAGYLQLHFENPYVRKDGQIIHIMWSARWLEKDQIRIAVARDITTRKHADPLNAASHAIVDSVPRWRLSASPPRLIPPGFDPIPRITRYCLPWSPVASVSVAK